MCWALVLMQKKIRIVSGWGVLTSVGGNEVKRLEAERYVFGRIVEVEFFSSRSVELARYAIMQFIYMPSEYS